MTTDLPTTDTATPPEGPNTIVVSPPRLSAVFWLRVAALAATLVTAASTYYAAVTKPKNPELAILILTGGTALASFLNGLHTEAVKGVALNAAVQASNRAPGDSGPKSNGGAS